MCNLLSITSGEYVLNGTKMVRTTSKLPIIINFHTLAAKPAMKTALVRKRYLSKPYSCINNMTKWV
jgi:hypothetical protein